MATAKSKRRTSYHHGDLQHAMVQAALELVSGQSPETLTLREVARRVGVNHRAAYRHFKDRLALFAAVAEQGYVDLIAALKTSLAPTPRAPAEARVRALGVAYVAFAVDRPSHYRIMFGRRLNEDGRFPQLEALAQDAFALLSGEIAAGQLHGAFGEWPLREAVFSFWALTHGFCDLMLTRRIRVKRVLLDEYAERIVAPFIEGLRARHQS